MSEINGNIRDEAGRFGIGNPGKPKGAVSNSSAKVKAAILAFLEKNVDKVQESFDKLDPVQKLQFITALLPYATPKLQSLQGDISIEGEWTVTLNINGQHKVHPSLDSDLPEKNPGLLGPLHSNGSGD